MMASWGILKKSGALLAIRFRDEKIAKLIGSIDDPVSPDEDPPPALTFPDRSL
jgi:hypothetical protein